MVNEEKIIYLHKKLGIKYENLKEFLDSFFEDVYYQAFINTRYIIESKGQNTGIRQNERMYNVIPFCGERGTGKTSAMSSFTESIRKFDKAVYDGFKSQCEGENKMGLMTGDEFEKYGFLCLECIDASLMAASDNIVGLILAKMLERFIDESQKLPDKMSDNRIYGCKKNRYSKNEIMCMFDEIYSCLGKLKKNTYEEGVSSFEALKELSGSLDLQEKIKEFVTVYLDTFISNGSNSDKMFLVISIDDLDISYDKNYDKNNDKSYDILEDLHKYFMIPHVIIYVTLSMEVIRNMCYLHYYNVFRETKNDFFIKKMTMSYIEKVLPFSNRVYLPELHTAEVNVALKQENTNNGIVHGDVIKDKILKTIARNTGVYFDSCGVKKHFYEPDNLRELINLHRLLENMCVVNEDELDKKLSNMRMLLEDVNNRLSIDKLENEQYDLYISIQKMDLERQGFSFAEYFKQILESGNYVADYKHYSYSYGELLRGIYVAGREALKEKKQLIHCILALETVSLTNIYLKSIKESDDEKEKYKNKLLRCMSNSVSGSWGNKLVPKISNIKGGKGIDWGYMQHVMSLENEESYIWELTDLTNISDMTREQITTSLLQSGFIKGMQIFLMFFVKNESEDSMKLDIKQDKLCISVSKKIITFDILGFVINCFCIDKFFEKACNSIKKALEEFNEIKEKEDEEANNLRKKIDESINANTLKNDFIEWEGKRGGYLAMPVYSTDIMYNVLKRAKRNRSSNARKIITEKEVTTHIGILYKNIAELLSKEDAYYGTNFSEHFKENPFVRVFTEESNSVLKNGLGDFLNHFVSQFAFLDSKQNLYEPDMEDEDGMDLEDPRL